jgi:competence protein ComEA
VANLGENRLPKPPRATRSEQAAVAVMLLAVVAPLAVSALWQRRPVAPLTIQRAPEREYDLKIDLNAATTVELEHLPGVGPKLAARIVADRESSGPFRSLNDFQRVKGIGPKLAAKIAPYLAPLPGDDRENLAEK